MTSSGHAFLTSLACCFATLAIADAGETAFVLSSEYGSVSVPVASRPEVTTAEGYSPDDHVVEIVVSPNIAAQICQLTRRLVEKEISIVVGCEVVSTAIVREPLCAGYFRLSGWFRQEEAQALATRIRAGAQSCGRPLS